MFFKVAIIFAIAASTQAFRIKDECLNYTIYPVQYDLTIIPYIYKDSNSYYECELTITVIANAPYIQTIELDAKDFEINQNDVKVYDGRADIVNKLTPFMYDDAAEKLYIYLTEPLKPYNIYKSKYEIKIKFRKVVKLSTPGIFLAPYEDKGKKFLFFSTRLSPNQAKHFFPCFNNPRFEAIFKFRVHVIKGGQYTNTSLVIANELRRHNHRDYYIIESVPSPQVALHQVGFHHSQYGSRQVTAKHTNDTIFVWGPPSKLHYYSFISEFSENMLNMIIEYSNIKRPLVVGPINVVAIPLMLDGYEVGSWNLLTNRDTRLAHVPMFTSISQEEKMTFELVQQLSRVWLGNPGEPQRTQWDEDWFKEGVATYLANHFLTKYQSTTMNVNALKIKHKVMAEDTRKHGNPPLTTFNKDLFIEIPSKYREFIQMKTASILWMVENWIGSEKFHYAFVTYINSKRGDYVSVVDFMENLRDKVDCLDQSINGSTAAMLHSWFHHPGYPVVNVEVLRDRTPNAIRLNQYQFSFTGEKHDSQFIIPITYMVQKKLNCYNCHEPRFTMNQTYTFVENLDGGWIVLNVNASGYYRVNYDHETWKLIAISLKDEPQSIPEFNRAQIVNDVFALYASGDMELMLAEEILFFLENEESPVVWSSVASGFELIKTIGAGCKMTKHLYKYWQDFLQQKLNKIYLKVHRVEANTESATFESRAFRRDIVNLACAVAHHIPCLNYLRDSYHEYTLGRIRLDPDTRETCYHVIFAGHSGYPMPGFNSFEVEDKLVAENKIRKERQFLYLLGTGHEIVRTTTEAPAALLDKVPETHKPIVVAEKHSGGAADLHTMSMLTILSVCLFIVIR